MAAIEQLYAKAKARELYETARAVNPLPREKRERPKRTPVARVTYSVRDAIYARLAWNGFSPGA
ncbi:MAG: hypothetical protein Kow0010_11130 [Dehalococcoidia bacterium]